MAIVPFIIGVICAVMLAVASKIMAVEADERLELPELDLFTS